MVESITLSVILRMPKSSRWVKRPKVYISRWFERFVRREGIKDADLCKAVGSAERGLIDADLGGGVIKQRIARFNQGKSGGYRSIILFRAGQRAIFVYGFAKSERGNIWEDELRAFRALAIQFMGYDASAISKALKRGAISKVKCEE